MKTKTLILLILFLFSSCVSLNFSTDKNGSNIGVGLKTESGEIIGNTNFRIKH